MASTLQQCVRYRYCSKDQDNNLKKKKKKKKKKKRTLIKSYNNSEIICILQDNKQIRNETIVKEQQTIHKTVYTEKQNNYLYTFMYKISAQLRTHSNARLHHTFRCKFAAGWFCSDRLVKKKKKKNQTTLPR